MLLIPDLRVLCSMCRLILMSENCYDFQVFMWCDKSGCYRHAQSILPAVWLRQILKRKLTWKIVLDYLKFFKKVQVSVHRLKFLRKCLKNDLIPDFLKFRVPENEVFSDQAVHNFQLKLLRTETSRANEDRKRYEEMLRKARSLVQKEIDKQWWASIFGFVRRQVESSLNTTSENHRKKLEKLSERQDKPLGGRNER